MHIKRIMVGPLHENCYIAYNESNQGVIIDPGADAEKISDTLAKNGITPVAIFLTHAHIDHIMAVEPLKEKYGLKVYMSALEQEFAADTEANLTKAYDCDYSLVADVLLDDGNIIPELDSEFKFISTPGHTPGSGCYYSEKHGVLFSGDTLFRGTVGRTDMAGGSMEKLIDSLKNKLLTLPNETIVYPGHAFGTTIEYEQNNPFV